MTKKKINATISSLIALVLVLNIVLPSVASAQIRPYQVNQNTDVGVFLEGTLEDAVVGCAQDALINGLIGAAGGVVQDYIGGLLGDFFGGVSLGNIISVGGLGTVPVNEKALQQINKAIRSDTAAQAAKEVGSFGGVSLDSIAFCLANNTIYALTEATANWINTGFGGNPIFVNNPTRYFGDVSRFELDNLVNQILEDAICIDINVNNIAKNLKRNYYARVGVEIPKCILGTIEIDVDGPSRGGFYDEGGWDAWLAYTTDPYSNYYGAQLSLNQKLNERISASQSISKIELDWNNGVQSIRDEDGNITTSGRIIESQALTNLNAPVNRLTFADEFDEIMNDLLNNFINITIGSY